MKQNQNQHTTSSHKISEELKAKVEQSLSEKVETPQTRFVDLVYSSCCGCGCTDIEIRREVPYNSKYKDGDRAERLLDTDVPI